MRALCGRLPECLTLVPLDFETGDLAAALATAGFRMEAAGAQRIHKRFVARGVWRFGMAPEAVSDFLAGYIERCVYAEKL